MIIELPVKCHNNHKANAYFQFHDGRMEFQFLGVPDSQNCPCSKLNLGEGWRTAGEPKIVKQKPPMNRYDK